jgi:hypothetical protein
VGVAGPCCGELGDASHPCARSSAARTARLRAARRRLPLATPLRPLPQVPAALRALLDPHPPTTTRPTHPVGSAAPGHPYGHTVLAAELAALHRATPGHRNHTLNRTAFKVYRYVASGLLVDDEVTAAFTQAALAIGLDAAEVARTLASARAAGLANPRGLPAVPLGEAAL